MKLDVLVDYMNKLYYHPFADSYGLKIKGRKENIEKIFLVYDPEIAVTRKVLDKKPDLIISHHPLDKENYHEMYGHKKIREAIENSGASLCVYHLVMDAHSEMGHNKLLLDEIGKRFPLRFKCKCDPILDGRFYLGNSGIFYNCVAVNELEKAMEQILSTDLKTKYTNSSNGDYCKKIAVVSGGYSFRTVDDCLENDIDTLVCGETNLNDIELTFLSRIWSSSSDFPDPVRDAKKAEEMLKLNILAFGHEETELIGLYALKEKIVWDLGYNGIIEVVSSVFDAQNQNNFILNN